MKKLLLALLFTFAALPAMAYGPDQFKLSLWDRAAFSLNDNNIDEIAGVDLGLGSTTEYLSGLQLDFLFAQTTSISEGVQASWLITMAEDFTGWQLSPVSISTHFVGAQTSLFTYNKKDLTGLQWAALTWAGDVTGVQLGFVNISQSIYGVQFGFVNYTKNIRGIQLGLVNIAENGWFPAMIFVNGRF